jgi:N-acetylmuramoyl-L-alanine amidase
MKPPPITDGIFPIRRGRLLIPVVSMALSMSIGLIELHAQTTGGNNVPPKKDIYELQEITDTPKGDTPLPIKLETYIKWLKKVNGEPESAPVDSDIQWAADKGESIFDPSYGATVELDFGKPFVKENTDEAKKVKVTATYSGSASVENSPRTKDVKRIYLDFWIAETKESDDDVLVVRAEDAQVAEDDKKVIHWAKVLVKHSAPSVLPLQLESTGEKKLYFYGEQQDPNQLPEDPPLEETLEKEYADGEWFWIGTEEKGTGKGKFKAQADAGTGYKDAPEEKTVNLLPVEVVELAPQLRDSNNNEIAGSEVPRPLPESNSMVEEAPVTNKIAHRELKVKIGSALKDKRITWTMDARFTPEGEAQPRFGGDWADAATSHRDRFETSTTFGAHAYRRISQEQAETTVDADGFTAIRANLPPIGFNKARVRIQIEGLTTEIELIDLDVQAVVVIDPGHGGTPETDFTSASWNNSTSPSGVLEKTMALSYGLELKTSLETHVQAQHLNLKVLMTRTTDTSISGQDRADLAKQSGADSIFIIHFNASAAHTARGTLEVRRTAGNVNPQEDIDFIDAALTRMVTAMQGFDVASNRRAAVVNDTSVASDTNLGNTAEYFPIRAGYCEVEFIDFGAHTADQADDTVDILLNTGPNAGPIKTAIANAIRDGIIHNLRTLPRTSP